ncbi:MAG TPA: hypothetical protein H9805_02805 [Candidatus Janibacter merdipullorum]|nr:hypothetical protein [Candidatus Janibacter merdipullorum]
MQMIRGTAALAAGVLMVGGMAACGDEGEPEASSSTASPSEVEPSSSSDSSDSGSSSSSSGSSETQGEGKVAELPEAAKKQTKAGAIAFNEFYQDQMGEALKTGKTETLEKFSHDACDVCDEYIRETEKSTARGITMDKNPNRIGESTATARSDNGYKVTVEVQAAEYQEVLKDGSRGRSADAVTYTVATDTQWTGDHWVIRDSVIVE